MLEADPLPGQERTIRQVKLFGQGLSRTGGSVLTDDATVEREGTDIMRVLANKNVFSVSASKIPFRVMGVANSNWGDGGTSWGEQTGDSIEPPRE